MPAHASLCTALVISSTVAIIQAGGRSTLLHPLPASMPLTTVLEAREATGALDSRAPLDGAFGALTVPGTEALPLFLAGIFCVFLAVLARRRSDPRRG